MVGKLVTGLILFMKVAMIRTAQVDFALNDSDIDMLAYHGAYYWITIFKFLILIPMQLIVSGTIGQLGPALPHAGME